MWISQKSTSAMSKNKNLDPEHIRTPKIIEIGLETMENGHFEVGCTLIEIFFKNLDF